MLRPVSDPLNVALVHHLPPGGGAFRVLAEYVARRPQHSFTLYTRMPEPRPHETLVALPDRVAIRRRPLPDAATPLRRFALLRALPRYGQALAAEIDAAGHDVCFVHASFLVQHHEVLPHLLTPTLAYSPEALRLVYEPRPDFGPRPTLRERVAAAGLDPYERTRKRLDREHARAAQAVVTHSRFTAEQLRHAYGVTAEVVPLGVDAAAFEPPETPPPREREVLSIGALHPFKGHQFVIEALGLIPDDRRPSLTLIADRGPLRDDLERLASERHVRLDVRQGIPFAELLSLYHRAGVMACAQIREPFGLITLEAMAAGLPVVAVDEGGLRETVQDGRTGLLVPRKVDAFAAALLRVLDDPALADRLRENALRAARDEWSWDETARAYDDRLRRLAAGGRRARRAAPSA